LTALTLAVVVVIVVVVVVNKLKDVIIKAAGY